MEGKAVLGELVWSAIGTLVLTVFTIYMAFR